MLVLDITGLGAPKPITCEEATIFDELDELDDKGVETGKTLPNPGAIRVEYVVDGVVQETTILEQWGYTLTDEETSVTLKSRPEK